MIANYLQKAARNEKGTFVVLMSLSLLAIFGFAALSIDIGHVYQQKRDLQCATDVASLGAVALLTNSSVSQGTIIQTALTIAQSNGVTSAEIAASDSGTIQVGTWNTNATPPTFTANTASGSWNAVRVPAKRTVGLFFGAMTMGPGSGLKAMSPQVHSVAALAAPSGAFGIAPFMLRQEYVTANGFGVPFTITKNTYKSTGDFGPLDLAGSKGTLDQQMTNGCQCTVSVGQIVSEDTGNSAPSGMLNTADGATVIMPILGTVGNHTAVVTGFAVVLITNVGGNHGNWSATFTILDQAVGVGAGGATGFPFAKDRILVE